MFDALFDGDDSLPLDIAQQIRRALPGASYGKSVRC